jgi:uncharacterized low-complexity protein
MSIKNKSALALTAATLLSSPLAMSDVPSSNPFTMNEIAGYATLESKGKEGKCGEGKCGETKTLKTEAEGKCGEGKCGEKKKGSEGKCGG